MAGGLGFKCTHRILAMPPNSRVALGFPGPFQVLEIGTRTCALSCSEGLQGLQSHKPASRQGLEQVSQGSHHCQFRSGTLGTQLGSIRVGAWEVREAWLSFSKAMQAHSHPGPRSADLSVALASVIWPEPRQVRHRPRHTSCSPASAEGEQRDTLQPSVLPALSLCPQHPPPPAWAWSPLCRPTTLQTGIWMVRSGCLSKGPMDWDA